MKKDDRPFSGIKVLCVARVYAAPFAAYQLALHGAEVINVEDPDTGDGTRSNGSAACKPFIEKKMSPPFLAHAAGKKSLALNLRTTEGREIFKKLAETSDVLIENLRAGSMDAMGLGYSDLQAINPRLIYASLTGYGQTGPKRRDAAIDPVIQAASGLMSITGTQESGPVRVGATVVDYASGFALTTGILTALFHRERSGRGQQVDVSMLETALVMMSATLSEVVNTGHAPKRVGNRSATNNHVSDVFECGDGRYLMIAATRVNHRAKLWQVLERPDIPLDARFKDTAAMQAHGEALHDAIKRTTLTRTAQVWEDLLNTAGVPCMKINSIAEIADHPQIKARELFQQFDAVPGLERSIRVPRASYKLSAAPAHTTTPPPMLGAHTDEILRALGYEDAALARMRQEGIIGSATGA